MIYGSVCSGIEAATVAWHPLGWRPAFFSEIEKFPSSVLARHYPNVPNLGDMTKFKEWPDYAIDVLVGGTPCQSFSIAGLRKGLADPRGNLTLTFLAIAEKYKPQFIVWENVSGILSDKTGALHAFLDGLEELGYVIDIDILDAQFFGLAQRRRRVFVCGQHRDDLLVRKTISSALTIAQCLIEILHLRFLEARPASRSTAAGLIVCGSADRQGRLDGIERRIRLFSLDNLTGLRTALDHLEFLNQQSCAGHGSWASNGEKMPTQVGADIKYSDTKAGRNCVNTASLPLNLLGDLCRVLNLSTTSTATNSTIHQEIFTYSAASLSIANLIAASSSLSPCYWSAASSTLTALQDFMNYARQATSNLFGDMERFSAWGDFIEQAERTSQSIRNNPTRCFGEILPFSESLSGHPPPRRETGKSVAPTIAARTRGGGGLGTDFDCDGGLITSSGNVSYCLNAGGMGRIDYETETIVSHRVCRTLLAKGNDSFDESLQSYVAHALRGEGHDASEDGTGRGTPLVCVHGTQDPCTDEHLAFALGRNNGGENVIAFSCKDYGADAGPLSPTLRSMGHDGSHANAGGQVAVAFAQNSRDEARLMGGDGQIVGALAAEPGMKQTCYVAQPTMTFQERGRDDGRSLEIGGDVAYALTAPNGGGRAQERNVLTPTMQVRRLTPRECERLQGFPDDYTDVPPRNKNHTPDGPRYKALGNSMAVNVMRWIGERIQMVENLK